MSNSASIDPIFISVKEAAAALGISAWSMYSLLDARDADDKPPIESRYQGRRRLVNVASLREYAANLPTEPQPKATA